MLEAFLVINKKIKQKGFGIKDEKGADAQEIHFILN